MQSKIVKIRKLSKKEKLTRYNLEVEKSHNYFANNILVHNCRCIATKHGNFSRKGEEWISVPHINRSLQPFFEEYPNAILDGELFRYELRQQLNELTKLVRKTVNISDGDLKRSEELVRFYVYDGYNFNESLSQDAPYAERKDWIDKNVIGKYDFIENVATYGIKSKEDLDSLFTQFIEDGQEGCILRNLDSGYKNARCKDLLKLKPVDDDEAVITNIKEGQGNWSNTGKTISVKWQNKEFDITFKGTYEDCCQFWKDRDSWKGRTITFNYFGLTGLGIPNYGQMDYRNCLKQ